MIEYWRENYPIMLIEMGQHAEMVFAALAIAIVVTIILVLVFLHRRNWLNGLVYFFSLLYSVPSFALFALLLPVTVWECGRNHRLAVYCEYVCCAALSPVSRGSIRRWLRSRNGDDQPPSLYEGSVTAGSTRHFSGIQVVLAPQWDCNHCDDH